METVIGKTKLRLVAGDSFDEVRLVLYTREDDQAYMIFADALQRLLATKSAE